MIPAPEIAVPLSIAVGFIGVVLIVWRDSWRKHLPTIGYVAMCVGVLVLSLVGWVQVGKLLGMTWLAIGVVGGVILLLLAIRWAEGGGRNQ